MLVHCRDLKYDTWFVYTNGNMAYYIVNKIYCSYSKYAGNLGLVLFRATVTRHIAHMLYN